jgi:hypothetical protein
VCVCVCSFGLVSRHVKGVTCLVLCSPEVVPGTDVRHHLHRLPEVVSLPLPSDDVLVHFPGGDVVLTVERAVDEPFVVSCCAKVVGMVNVGE